MSFSKEIVPGFQVIETANILDLERIIELNSQIHIDRPGFTDEDQWDGKEWIGEEIKAGNFFVFRDNGQIYGTTLLAIWDDALHITTLTIDQTMHGLGIGKKLTEFAENLAAEKGLKKVTLETYDLYSVKDFYLKCGFELDNPPTDSYKGEIFYCFSKTIQ